MTTYECELVRSAIYALCDRVFCGIVFAVSCKREKFNEPIEVTVKWADGPNKHTVDQVLLALYGPRFYENGKCVIESRIHCTRKISRSLSARIRAFVERLCELKGKRFNKRLLTAYRHKWSMLGYPGMDKYEAFKGIVRS